MAEQAPDSAGAAEPPAADHERSGQDADEAIVRAETGSQVDEAHTTTSQADSAQARAGEVLEVYHETEGGTGNDSGHGTETGDLGSGTGAGGAPARTREPGPSPTASGSGGAQNIIGGRISDRVSAGEPRPEGPPFDPSSDRDQACNGS